MAASWHWSIYEEIDYGVHLQTLRENVRKECGLLMPQITEASSISRMTTDIWYY